MSFFAKIQSAIQRFLYGKNGVDILSRDMNLFALLLILVDSILNTFVIYFIGLLLFIIAIFRICSRNIAKRQSENRTYLAIRGKVISYVKTKWQYLKSKKYYRYYKCTSCKQKLRVPKGKGKIEIVCPKCGLRFTQKT